MPFETRLLIMFFPGGLLVISAGFLPDVVPDFATAMGILGLALLIIWPIITITAHVRHSRKLERGETADHLHSFVSAVERFTFAVVLPSAVLGGVGALFLFSEGDDSDFAWVKSFVGISLFGVLGAYLLRLVRRRSALTLRIIGAALGVCGLAGIVAAIASLRGGAITVIGGVILAVACVGLVALGGWAAVTGRNTFKRAD